MMRTICMGVAAVAGTLLSTVPPVQAASPISNAFVANVETNLDFLAKASRLAQARATSSAARAFAAEETSDVERVTVALDEARPADSTTKLAAADTDVLMTGRSVAVDVPKGGQPKAANGRVPLGERDLAALAKLSGKRFDDALWLKQVDALSQLRADYQAYADDGDDPALSKLAEHELRNVETRLAALAKI